MANLKLPQANVNISLRRENIIIPGRDIRYNIIQD